MSPRATLVAVLISAGICVWGIKTTSDDTTYSSSGRPADVASADIVTSSGDAAAAEPVEEVRAFTQRDIAELVADPDGWQGANVTGVAGKAFNIESNGGTTALQVWVDSDQTDSIMVYTGVDTAGISEGDFVRVSGTVGEMLEGENGFGAQLTLATITANTVTEVSALAAAPPALRTVTTRHQATEEGVTLTVRRVEFAADETRVVASVRNSSGAKVMIWASSAKAVQGRRQVEATFSDYGDLPSDILPGAVVSGVIVFPKLDPNTNVRTRLVVEGSSDNYDVTFDPIDLVIA